MKILKKFFLIVFPMLVLIGCATTYQKEGVFTNGYSDFRPSLYTFVVTFRASEHTPKEDVFRYAVKRCAELTVENGFRYFSVLDEVSIGPGIHYPSIRLHIECSHLQPNEGEWIDATLL